MLQKVILMSDICRIVGHCMIVAILYLKHLSHILPKLRFEAWLQTLMLILGSWAT